MKLTEAVANFARATRHCDNLIAVHRGHGGGAQGRRDKETSINRAVVVLTVASWQAIVQDLAKVCIALGQPAAASPLSPGSYALLCGRLNKEIGDFSTPNAENTRRLLLAAGVDPRADWRWTQHGGRGAGMISFAPHNVENRMNDWLKVRHAIAHGHAALPAVAALQSVRQAQAQGKPTPADPSLRLVDAEACLNFFRQVAGLTTTSIASFHGLPTTVWPW
jgi:hypothetical protein